MLLINTRHKESEDSKPTNIVQPAGQVPNSSQHRSPEKLQEKSSTCYEPSQSTSTLGTEDQANFQATVVIILHET
jgi:hypothetical protein